MRHSWSRKEGHLRASRVGQAHSSRCPSHPRSASSPLGRSQLPSGWRDPLLPGNARVAMGTTTWTVCG